MVTVSSCAQISFATGEEIDYVQAMKYLLPLLMMTARLTLAFSLVLLLPGCGKKTESAGPATVPATAETTPGGAITNAAVDLTELSRELRKWIVRNQRPPKSFDEFAASSGVQIPPAPPGKKYAVDKTMHVILVNR